MSPYLKPGDTITIGSLAAADYAYQMAVGLTAVVLSITDDIVYVSLGGLNTIFIHIDDALPLWKIFSLPCWL